MKRAIRNPVMHRCRRLARHRPLLLYLFLFLSMFMSIFGAAVLDGGGMLYSHAAGYMLCAPKGWIFDNESGLVNNFNCVMYPKGSTWGGTKVMIYAEINDLNKRTLEEFIKGDIENVKKQSKNPEFVVSKKIMLKNKYPAIAVDFFVPDFERYEKVMYVQSKETNTVCLIVFSARSKDLFEKNKKKVYETVKELVVMEMKND